MTREAKALEVLQAGGFFRYALETGYRGVEKFHMRLYTANRQIVSGIGHATKRALESVLIRRECAPSSTWPEEWILDSATNSARVEWLSASPINY